MMSGEILDNKIDERNGTTGTPTVTPAIVINFNASQSLKGFAIDGNESEVITGTGKETVLGGKHIKAVQTNKIENNTNRMDQWTLIDVNTLKRVKLSLKDSSDEHIVNRRGQGDATKTVELLGKKVVSVSTNKSGENLVLIDRDTLEKLDLHVEGEAESITDLGEYGSNNSLNGQSVFWVRGSTDKKNWIVYADSLKKVTTKNNSTEFLTKNSSDTTSTYAPHAMKLGGKEIGRFEINNDTNNTFILDKSTLEKVTVKDEPEQVILDYTNHSTSPYEWRYKLGGKDIILAYVVGSDKPVVLYANTLERVALSDMPDQFITGFVLEGSRSQAGQKIKVEINDGEIIAIDRITVSID